MLDVNRNFVCLQETSARHLEVVSSLNLIYMYSGSKPDSIYLFSPEDNYRILVFSQLDELEEIETSNLKYHNLTEHSIISN